MRSGKWMPIAVAVLAGAGLAGCGEKAPSPEDRGQRAVGVCRDHGGVVAFEDDIIICRDQSSHVVKE